MLVGVPVLSRLPNRRTLAAVMSVAAPTPERSKRRNVCRVYPGAVTFFTSVVVAWPKFWLAYVPSRTYPSATAGRVTLVVVRAAVTAAVGVGVRPAPGSTPGLPTLNNL